MKMPGRAGVAVNRHVGDDSMRSRPTPAFLRLVVWFACLQNRSARGECRAQGEYFYVLVFLFRCRAGLCGRSLGKRVLFVKYHPHYSAWSCLLWQACVLCCFGGGGAKLSKHRPGVDGGGGKDGKGAAELERRFCGV